ncbi:hypothetical protein DFP72DRAFT_855478 [Ephemerocybe angulata]|uniref:Uncharacterized protein n=1 Tax=Ephemerocybe angulata TaxID=980116 RepID=A0A8H6HHI8_9AGAR|nr:hypothetical protein DFP72DRAFT_855478 [Tulosesus angulatus]
MGAWSSLLRTTKSSTFRSWPMNSFALTTTDVPGGVGLHVPRRYALLIWTAFVFKTIDRGYVAQIWKSDWDTAICIMPPPTTRFPESVPVSREVCLLRDKGIPALEGAVNGLEHPIGASCVASPGARRLRTRWISRIFGNQRWILEGGGADYFLGFCAPGITACRTMDLGPII